MFADPKTLPLNEKMQILVNLREDQVNDSRIAQILGYSDVKSMQATYSHYKRKYHYWPWKTNV